MNLTPQIKTALDAADSAILVQSSAQAARAAKTWRKCALVGIDTEFVRERTYRARLGMVQVSDGHTVWLMDALVEGVLDPLIELFKAQSTQKIIHSPSEDFEVLLQVLGQLPEPAIDTQLACALLGQSLQLGYHKAVEWLTGIEIDKDQTRSNWCARPLRQEQLRYAALDVCLLPLMWESLEAQLMEAGRLDWFKEDAENQLARAREPTDPQAAWQRIRGAGNLDGTSLAVLQKLAAWRERTAKQKDLPRGFIVKDPVLIAISRQKTQKISDLSAFRDLHHRERERYGEQIVRIVRETLESGAFLEPEVPLTPHQRQVVKRLRDYVAAKAAELGVEPALLASRKTLEEILRSAGDEATLKSLGGWRHELLADDLARIVEED